VDGMNSHPASSTSTPVPEKEANLTVGSLCPILFPSSPLLLAAGSKWTHIRHKFVNEFYIPLAGCWVLPQGLKNFF